MFNFDITRILLTLPGIIIGLAFHEFAHAYASDKLGDPTPRNLGRLTLSPMAHIDPLGLLLIVFVGFGWAKPVPVNSRYYRHPRRDDIIVSVAGVAMNLLIAIIFTALLKFIISSDINSMLGKSVVSNLLNMIYYAIQINIVLLLFNLIPIPPLDGFHVLTNILPFRSYGFLSYMEQYGSIILMVLIITRATSFLIGYPSSLIVSGIFKIFGL